MTCLKREKKHLLHVALALLLCTAMMTSFAVPAKAYGLSGDWEKVKIDDLTTYAFVLDSSLINVSSFDLGIDVEMKAGARCEKWNVWVRRSRGGSFEQVDNIYLDGGNGAASKTIRFTRAQNINAVAITPVASGSFSWTLYMTLSDPGFAANHSGSDDGDGYLPGDWEKVSIVDNGREYNVYAFVPTDGMYCRQFDLYVDIDMRANTKCYDWHVWVRRNGVFEQVDEIYLPSGRGSASETIKLGSLRRNVDAIALIPIASGSFTWSISMGISNPE